MEKLVEFLLKNLRRQHVLSNDDKIKHHPRRPLFEIAPFVLALDNETPSQIATRTGENLLHILELNAERIEGLKRNSKLIENTKLLLPPRPNRFLKKELQDEDDLADVIAYVVVGVTRINTTPSLSCCSHHNKTN